MKPNRFFHTAVYVMAFVAVVSTTKTTWGQSESDAKSVKYWIVFKDKDAGLGKGPAAVEPGYVTERARIRRELRGRSVPGRIDSPVSSMYVAALRSMGVEPIVQSRWMNAVSAELSAAQRRAVEQLSFVSTLKTVAAAVEESVTVLPVVVAEQHAGQDLDFGGAAAQLTTINAIETINEGFIGSGVLLGFLDTLTDTLHPALKHLSENGRIVGMRDFPVESGLPPQTNKHGLLTSSVALGFDEGQLIGACYGADFIFGTTEYDKERNQEEDFFVAGMEWMERMGTDIVNVSLGYSVFDEGQHSYTYEDMDGDTPITTRAADRAAELGVVVVTSAGNEGCTNPDNCWYYVTSPADGDSVITAGASDFNFNPVSFSGSGPTYDGRIKPDVAAPGTGIYSAISNGGYSGGYAGTSFSSPLVASVACQILQANPTLNPIDVRTILRSTASQSANPDNKLGWGVINSRAAVDLAKIAVTGAENEGVPDGNVSISVYPNPVVEQAFVTVEAAEERGELSISLFDVLGREVTRARPTRMGSTVRATLVVRGLPAGAYFVRVSSDRFEATRSLIVTD